MCSSYGTASGYVYFSMKYGLWKEDAYNSSSSNNSEVQIIVLLLKDQQFVNICNVPEQALNGTLKTG